MLDLCSLHNQNNDLNEKSLAFNLACELKISLDELYEIINNLEKVDEDLVVSDFDDTLYSRFIQLQNPILSSNRWHAWNTVIVEKLWWFWKFVDDYYSEEWLTNFITNIVKTNISIILTAWIKEFQELKIKKVWLDNIPKVIVDENSHKPLALLKYIIFEYKKIPRLIKIYDDRVIHLSDKWPELAKLLNTQIKLYEVELDKTEIWKLTEFNFKCA